MKRILPYLVGVVLLLLSPSCDPEEEGAVPFQQKEVYLFESIEYFLEETDGSFDQSTPEMTAEGTNYINASGMLTFYPLMNVQETSLFSTRELDEYEFSVPENLQIPIPEEVVGNQIVLGEPKAKFDIALTQYFSGDWSEKKVYLQIPPRSTMYYNYVICYQELRVSFRATFVGADNGKNIVVEGKWEGMHVMGVEGETTVAPLSDPFTGG